MKTIFNIFAKKMIRGYQDENEIEDLFPDGLKEHICFINRYLLRDNSHKQAKFWRKVYER